MKRLEKDFPRLAQTLRDFQSALLETGLASDGAIQDVLCACRQGLAAGAAFAVCVPPADDVPALTAASFSDGEPDAEKILLPLKEICRGHPASGIYDADGLCERAPGDAPSLLHRGIFRGKETVGCVGVIGEPGRAWTPGEKHAVRLLGNALRGHVIENHDRLLSERECGEGRGSRDRLEQEKRNVAVDELIVNVFDSCYLIDLDEDAFVVVRRSASLERYIPRKGRYSATIAEWADHLVASEDREQVKQMLSPAFMRSRLREVARYSVPYVSTRGGWRRHFEAQVVRGDGGDGVHNVIVAFLDQEDVVRQDMEQKQRQAMLQELVHAGAWSIENVRGSHTLTARFSDVMRHLMGFEGAGDLPDTFEAFLERVHPDHRDRTFSRVWQALREADAEKSYEWEYRVLTKDRGYRWFRASGRVSKVSRDSVRLFGVFIDIDDRKEHDRLVQEKLAAYEKEHLLKEELEHEKKVVDLLHGMLNSGRWGVRFRPDGTIEKLEMSKDFKRMLGHSPEENYPASPEEWEAGIAPDQRARVVGAFYESVRSAAHRYEDEYRVMTKDRGYRWFRAVARGIADRDGVLKEYVGVFFDITEKKRIERLHYAESIINILSDEFDSVTYVERKSLNAVPYRRNAWIERYIPGWNDTPSFLERCRLFGEKLVAAEDLADYRRGIAPERALAAIDEKGVYEVNYRIRRDGALFYYQTKMVRDANSSEGSFVIGLRSTDAQVRHENEQNRLLTEACRKADEANNAKSSFLFNMSHDIRTPMNAILGYVGLSRKYVHDAKRVLGYLLKVDIAGRYLLNLINEVLDLARIESGHIATSEKAVSIREEIGRVMDMLNASAKAHRVEMGIRYEGLRDDSVYIDPLHFDQVLVNVISNAIKYTSAGGRVGICARQREEAPEGFAAYDIEVRDNGIGMAPEFVSRIFDSFTRERTKTVRSIEGAGLGMAITKRLVAMMGGDITVESELGVGTTVTVSMTWRIAEAGSVGNQSDEIEDDDANLNGIRVLLVEDNPLNREIAVDMLQEFGAEVDEAENGRVAVRKIEDAPQDRYDIVLMDVQMPVMDGYEATRAIRGLGDGRKSGLPIIAMTANAFDEDRQNAKEAGMNDHLAKPVDVRRLKNCLKRFAAKA